MKFLKNLDTWGIVFAGLGFIANIGGRIIDREKTKVESEEQEKRVRDIVNDELSRR